MEKLDKCCKKVTRTCKVSGTLGKGGPRTIKKTEEKQQRHGDKEKVKEEKKKMQCEAREFSSIEENYE